MVSTLQKLLVVLMALGAGACARGRSEPPQKPESERGVSVGYGTQSEGDVTGAVSHASREALDTRGISRMDQLLERLPGVQIVRRSGLSFHVRIRGARSVLSSEDPLLIVDGTPVQPTQFAETIGSISPGDVASIDILRDGSAAIYGVRGANGVILIQTKRATD